MNPAEYTQRWAVPKQRPLFHRNRTRNVIVFLR
jgi:hypothetical protein